MLAGAELLCRPSGREAAPLPPSGWSLTFGEGLAGRLEKGKKKGKATPKSASAEAARTLGAPLRGLGRTVFIK